jgi:hypothetical protein
MMKYSRKNSKYSWKIINTNCFEIVDLLLDHIVHFPASNQHEIPFRTEREHNSKTSIVRNRKINYMK